jgi:repressor of nif and glnA expression
MAESDSFMDCDVCMKILNYLNEGKESIEVRKIDGYMRTQGVTTTDYHIKKHLEPLSLVTVTKKGTIKKKPYAKITEKGAKLTDKTLNRE